MDTSQNRPGNTDADPRQNQPDEEGVEGRRNFLLGLTLFLAGGVNFALEGNADAAEATPEKLYDVDIPRLRATLRNTGVLALTHNGESEMENEYWRIAGDAKLGPVTRHGQGKNPKNQSFAIKRCPLRIITGTNSAGQDITQDVESINWTVIDVTKGDASKEAKRVIGSRKYGLILCAGHVSDIPEIAKLSGKFCAPESLLMLGGCRTAPMIRDFYRPKRLVTGSNDGIGTELFTHFTKVTAATLLGNQFSTWEEYFRNMQQRYSYEMQRRPDTYIFPGNPNYAAYTKKR
ncbi:MAG: hypothetical protein WCT36_03840 [Candidatus Gracilibacteria bacterium]